MQTDFLDKFWSNLSHNHFAGYPSVHFGIEIKVIICECTHSQGPKDVMN